MTKVVSEDMRNILEKLKLFEADDSSVDSKPSDFDSENNDEEDDNLDVDDTTDGEEEATGDESKPNLVKNLMTNKKPTDKLDGNINVVQLGNDLGLEDIEARQFNTAFQKLKKAATLGVGDFAAITAVFDRLLAADASTTSKVINSLRRIHRAEDTALAEAAKGMKWKVNCTYLDKDMKSTATINVTVSAPTKEKAKSYAIADLKKKGKKEVKALKATEEKTKSTVKEATQKDQKKNKFK